jgi:hypothetical protein
VTKLDIQFDVLNDTPASASPVDANFDRIEQHINQELVERDGTVAMRAQLRLVGDPVSSLDATPKQYVDAILPIGIIMMYGGTVVPPGGKWALCNGAEVETAAYPELFAVLGVSFVLGTPAAGRFNLPNLNNRMPLGAGTAALGAVGGTANATLLAHDHDVGHQHASGTTQDDSPDHGHTTSDHFHAPGTLGTGYEQQTHYHLDGYGGASLLSSVDHGNGIYVGVASGGLAPFYYAGTGADIGDHAHSVISGFTGAADRTLGTTGANTRHRHVFQPPAHAGRSSTEGTGTGANANLPPYQAVNYIVRVS